MLEDLICALIYIAYSIMWMIVVYFGKEMNKNPIIITSAICSVICGLCALLQIINIVI